ncbi:MAG: hypothetical protein Q9218_007350 [Villophora microphyllina]
MAPTGDSMSSGQIVGVLASILSIPLFMAVLWYLVTRWGWWKLYRPGPRRPLIRTWHGWIESGVNKNRRERNRLHKPPPPRLLPRTTKADYSHVFWDPTREKQRKFQQERDESILRYAPRWLRSSAFGSENPSSEAEYDRRIIDIRESDHSSATDGFRSLALMGRRWNRDWRGARPCTDLEAAHGTQESEQSSSSYFTVPEDDIMSTIRMRKPVRRAGMQWKADSEGVERVMNVQLFRPTAGERLVKMFEVPAEDYGGMMRHPERRVRTWTCGTTRAGLRSASASLVDIGDGSVEEVSDEDSKPRIRRKRERKMRRTQDTADSAEGMSMIEVSIGQEEFNDVDGEGEPG